MLFVNEGFTFRNFLVDAITIFVFIVTIWLLITVFMDLFRRHDILGELSPNLGDGRGQAAAA
jgi:hypothetical protein